MAYNGWKNYETWNVALWLGNDEGLYHAAREARRGQRMNGTTAEALVRELLPDGTPDFHGDASRYAKVHWPSIAGCIREL